jgi:hypothetical protein
MNHGDGVRPRMVCGSGDQSANTRPNPSLCRDGESQRTAPPQEDYSIYDHMERQILRSYPTR